MAEIRAFRGTFFNHQRIEDVSRALAPPYDVIDEQRRQDLVSRSPYNIVRLIMPEPGLERDFWDASAATFRAWKDDRILVRDASRCIYAYRQTFNLPEAGMTSRSGILAALRCRNLGSGDILPHEKTFPHTREERLNLLRACEANFSQIFTVFRDPGQEAMDSLERAMTGASCLDVTDVEGVRHQLWRMEDHGQVAALARIIRDRKLIIADGHHRYETANIYSKDVPGGKDTNQAALYVSVAMFRSEDPGLIILPVHRILRGCHVSDGEVRDRIGRYFEVEELRGDILANQGMLQARLEESRRPAFVMIITNGYALLRLRPGVDPVGCIEGPESNSWKRLDVSVLHTLVLREALGLDADRLAEEGRLYFTPWESKALGDVSEGRADAAFIMRPTLIEDIWRIARGGERMPHKSSYFYPKLPSGLVIYDHATALS
ncbi:MAG: DUF1015 domain-containing protein [Actinomycetota bacterium]|nr:DUF1015 domain-containing protein [Actinomycetota bacterium]